MQQAIYNKTISQNVTAPQATAPMTLKHLSRHFAHRWDLYAILSLLGSCGAYALSALAHVA